jgi:hypothetical protein
MAKNNDPWQQQKVVDDLGEVLAGINPKLKALTI